MSPNNLDRRNPLKLRQSSAANARAHGPPYPNTLSRATYEDARVLECCREILSAAASSTALETLTRGQFYAFLDVCLHERAQGKRPEGGRSKNSGGGSSVAAPTPAAHTPHRSSKQSSKKRSRKSDDGEDGSERGKRGAGGKGREENARYACPFYIFDKHRHYGCRSLVLRDPSDVRWHITRTHQVPETICPTCWTEFPSRGQLRNHRKNPCGEQPFPRHWARQRDLDELSRVRVPGQDPDYTWFAMYYALFSIDTPRLPSFPTAFSQDVVDMLLNYSNSVYYQSLVPSLGNGQLPIVWQSVSQSIVGYLQGGSPTAILSGLAFDEHLRSLGLGSHAFTQETEHPQAGQVGLFGPSQTAPQSQTSNTAQTPSAAAWGFPTGPLTMPWDPFMGYSGPPGSPPDSDNRGT